ncbi:hypothetical protein GJ496_000618 [Pomphorhynchus laevis]|nr:hypothetical protein GJ496_000618 [Pomphorhynchus laevis]
MIPLTFSDGHVGLWNTGNLEPGKDLGEFFKNMAPKSSQRTGLYFFADEYRRKTDRRLNIREAIDLCYTQWKNLSQDRKDVYNKKAKQYQKDVKDGKILGPGGKDGRRQNCLGVPMADTRDRLVELIRRKHIEIDYLVKRLDLPFDQLMQTEFLIMSYQIFCETSEGLVLPAEISICRWSLIGKIRDVLTITMRPPEIPSGYASDVMDAENIHGIPAFGQDAKKLHDYCFSWNSFKHFIGLRQADDLYVDTIVFMLEGAIDRGMKILERLSSESMSKKCQFTLGVPNPANSTIGVISCESLFSTLWKSSTPKIGEQEPSSADALQIMTRDTYAYDKGICCEYHETIENINCSQNKLKHICMGLDQYLHKRYFADQSITT